MEVKSSQDIALNFSELVVPSRIGIGSNESIELQSLMSVAKSSIEDAAQILADTSEAEKLLQLAQEFKEKNEIPYATEYAFRAKESAENAKDIRIKEYFGGFIMILIIGLIVYKRKHK